MLWSYKYNLLEHMYEEAFLLSGASYSQSFSGSETDVSTSTENLSPEERYALAHTQRQEPQGQENVGGGTAATMASSHFTQASDIATTGGPSTSTARFSE